MCIRDRCYGEGDIDRGWCIASEIELYKLKRNYGELRKGLPVGREIQNYFGNICRNNNNNDLSDVTVKEYKNEKTTYLTLKMCIRDRIATMAALLETVKTILLFDDIL